MTNAPKLECTCGKMMTVSGEAQKKNGLVINYKCVCGNTGMIISRPAGNDLFIYDTVGTIVKYSGGE